MVSNKPVMNIEGEKPNCPTFHSHSPHNYILLFLMFVLTYILIVIMFKKTLVILAENCQPFTLAILGLL